MNVASKIDKILSEFGIKVVTDSRTNLKKKLDERAFSAKGKSVDKSRLSASIDSKVSYSSGGIKLKIIMNDYWDIVDGGRRASSVSEDGKLSIQKWANTRGFTEKIRLSDLKKRKEKQSKSKTKRKKKVLKKMDFDKASKVAAFLIARSLEKKQLEPTNFFTEVIKDGRLKELKEKLSELIKTDIIIEIKDVINR